MPSPSRLWVALVAAAIVASGIVATHRLQVEQHNRRVEIIVDWNEVQALAFASGTGPARRTATQVLSELHRHGVSGLVVTEATLSDLLSSGRISVRTDANLPPGDAVALAVPNPALASQIAVQLSHRAGAGSFRLVPAAAGQSGATLVLPSGLDAYRGIGTGLPAEALQAAREAGVEVVARVSNFDGANREAIDFVLGQLAWQKVHAVIFSGMEVLGNKALIRDTAELMRRHHLEFGYVEFGKQRGDVEMARFMDGQILRVHSITDSEMAMLSRPEAVDRFVKAARERDIRLAYVRLSLQPGPDPVADNVEYLDAIARGMGHVGLTVGPAHPYEPLAAGKPLLLLAGVGVVAGTLLLLDRLFLLPAGLQIALFLLGALGSGGLLGLSLTENLARKLLALVAALVFPTLAVLVFGDPAMARTGKRENHGAGAASDRRLAPSHPLRAALAIYLKMSLITLAGALLVVGLLGDTRFLLKYDQFVGIKAAHILPLFVLMAVLVTGAMLPAASWQERWGEAKRRVRELLADPIFGWQALALGVGLVLLAILVLRSGNDPGVGVSNTELKFRALMDRFLYVRPRTKEFLIGHPAMILALWASLVRWRKVWGPALLVGAIGQVSILNTFCHIHTPLMVTLLRVANGLVLGAVFGAALVWVLARFRPVAPGEPAREEKTAAR